MPEQFIPEVETDAPGAIATPDPGVVFGLNVPTFHILWEKRRWISQFVLTSVILVSVISLLVPNEYESTSRLMPPDPQTASSTLMLAALSGRSAGLGGIAGDLLGVKSTGALFVGMLNSDTVKDKLIDQFDLRKVYRDRYYRDARKDLSTRTNIVEDRKSGIISITVTDRDPRRARALAVAYVEELNRLVSAVSTSAARREREFLQQRLGQVKTELDAASHDLAQFSSKNITLDPQAQGKAMVDAAAQLQGQLIASEAEQKSLSSMYTESNVRVRAVEARIAELKSQLSKLSGSNEDATRADGDFGYPTLRQLPVLGATYLDYYRRTKILEVVFESLTSQFELAKVEEAKDTPSVKVLDPGEVPEKKSSPHRATIAVASFVLSLFVAVGWIFGEIRWRAMPPHHPAKVIASEVFNDLPTEGMKRRIRWVRLPGRWKHRPYFGSDGNGGGVDGER